MRLALQVVASAILVVAVFWGMWRLPRGGHRWFGWAPPLALSSVWTGLLALAMTGLLWVLPYPDSWVSLVFLVLDPMAIAAGVLVLWIYRGYDDGLATINQQRIQAKVGIAIGLIAIVIGYVYVMSHKAPATLTGS